MKVLSVVMLLSLIMFSISLSCWYLPGVGMNCDPSLRIAFNVLSMFDSFTSMYHIFPCIRFNQFGIL